MLKRALFASAVFVIAAMPMQAVVTPALAGQIKVKPKVKVVPKLRVRVPRPKIRVRIDTKRLLKKKAPVLDPAASGVASTISKPKIDSRDLPPGFAENAERLSELAQIEAFKEHIEDILGMLNIAGLDGTPGIPGLSDWGTGAGEDGNPNNLPGADGRNNDGLGNRPGFDDPGRGSPGSGTDYSGVASSLLGRVSGGLGSGEKMGGAVTAAPSPGDAIGGIAAGGGRRETGRRVGAWESGVGGSGNRGRTTTIYFSDGTRTERRYTQYSNGTSSVSYEDFDKDGNATRRFYSPSTSSSEPVTISLKGSGDAGKPDIGKPKDIAKLQDPDADGGVVVWIPPSCGSAKCNAMREFLKNPKGALQQYIATKSTRVSGDREGDPNTATTRLEIDQHGLVVSYGAESGRRHAEGGRVERLGKTRIQK